MCSDADLVGMSCSGDRSALERLLLRHMGGVRTSLLSYLGPIDALDDLVQETLLRGVRDLAKLRDPSRFGAWLRGISRHISNDHLRERYRKPLQQADDEHEWPALPLPEEADFSPLVAAVLKLPLKLREAVLLFYVEQFSYEEIGKRLEVTPAAVNRRLTRAREQLRGLLSSERGSA